MGLSALGGDDVARIDSHQLRRLVDAHGAALVLYARQWCLAPDDALQEALMDLIRLPSPPDHPPAWLYKAVRRRAMNLARAEQRRAKHQRQAGELAERWFRPPDEEAESEQLRAALECLAQLDREIVVARVWGELSLQQVAELVELSTSTVHRRYHQALAQLQQWLEGDQEDAEDEPRSFTVQ